MLTFSLIFLTLLLLPTINGNDADDLAKARCSFDILRRKELIPSLEGFVGVGYDNLLSISLATVFANNFSLCRLTPDNAFMIPNYLQILAGKKLQFDRLANFYEHFTDYYERETDSINFGGSATGKGWTISGSFSQMYQDTKETMTAEKSSVFVTKVSYHAYTLLVQPDAELHPALKARLIAIGDALDAKLIRRAKYLSEILIRDYGTHVLTKVEIGAKIQQEDFVHSNMINEQTEHLEEYKAAIGIGFANNVFGVSAGVESSTDIRTNETLAKARTASRLLTFGGPNVNRLLAEMFLATSKSGEHIALTIDDLVPLDVSGVPLYTLITEQQISEIRATKVDMIMSLIKNATELYYNQNFHSGCMNESSPNFSNKANSDDGNCLPPPNNYTFGGMYQTCKRNISLWIFEEVNVDCNENEFSQVNTITGNYSCPEGYNSEMLYKLIHKLPDKVTKKSVQKCTHFGILDGCFYVDEEIIEQEHVLLTAYICKSKPGITVEKDHGYMFGGLYSKNQINAFTGNYGCTGHYQGFHLAADVTICLSRDYQLDGMHEVKFSGFFSCQSPVQKCEDGYSQHLVTVLANCEIYYCVRPEAFNRVERNPIKRPPFEDISSLTSNVTESTVNIYVNDTLVISSPFREILTNVSLERASQSESGKNELPLTMNEALNIWLNNMDMVIDSKMKEYYKNQSNNFMPLITEQTMIPLIQAKTIIIPTEYSSKSISIFEVIIFIGILAVFIMALVGIVMYRKRHVNRSYAPLIDEHEQYNMGYENDNL